MYALSSFLLSYFYLFQIITCNNVTTAKAKPPCVDTFLDPLTIRPIDVKKYCDKTICVTKCCLENKFLFSKKGSMPICLTLPDAHNKHNITITIDYSRFPTYVQNHNEVEKSNSDFKSQFKFVLNRKMTYGHCASGRIFNDGDVELTEQFHLLDNGKLLMSRKNYYHQFPASWEENDFCVDYIVFLDEKSKVSGPFSAYRYVKENDTKNDNKKIFDHVNMIAMPISLIFLALVLLVYGFLRELRNLVGMVLMAYVGTLAVTFLVRVIILLGKFGEDTCKPMSAVLYYFIMSTFFWMNIMSFDIWWAFRGIRKARDINRRGEMVKFGWYSLYAYGAPFLVTSAVTAIDYADLIKHPHIYKPHFGRCFYISDIEMELRHYLFMPLLALLLLNIVFFLLTGYNLWLINKDLSRYANEASKYNKQHNRFLVYIRLFVVMGISWIFEVLPLPHWLELAATIYNGLVGVAIFAVFVFKRKIFFKLCHRFKFENKIITDLRTKYDRNMSLAPSSSSQERKRSNLSEMSIVSSKI